MADNALNDYIDKQLRKHSWLRRTLLGVAAVGAIGATILQIIASVSSESDKPFEPDLWFAGFQLVGAVLAIIIPALFAIFDDTPADLVITANKLKEERDQKQREIVQHQRDLKALENEFAYTITVYMTAAAMGELSDPLLIAEPGERENLRRQSVLAVLDRLIERQQTLFGMGDEYWTFGVYRWSAENEQLEMFATRRKSRDSEDREHRAWKPGEGHVGQAFKSREELVCANVNNPNVSGFVKATGDNERSYDESTYVSFASIPIRIGDREQPLGVLVATSDNVDRFVPAAIAQEDKLRDTIEPLRAAANTLATILGLNHIEKREGE